MAEPLSIVPREPQGVATIMARKGADTAAIAAVLGLELPQGPAARCSGGRTVVGTGPGTWLLIDEVAAHEHAEALATMLAGFASVSDQSSAYAFQRLSGAGARVLLQRGVSIDLHPSVFGPGAAATTVIAHIGVMLWQVDDAPSYDLACFRSYAHSLSRWIGSASHA